MVSLNKKDANKVFEEMFIERLSEIVDLLEIKTQSKQISGNDLMVANETFAKVKTTKRKNITGYTIYITEYMIKEKKNSPEKKATDIMIEGAKSWKEQPEYLIKIYKDVADIKNLK